MAFLLAFFVSAIAAAASVIWGVVSVLGGAIGGAIGAIGGIVGAVSKTIGQAIAPPVHQLSLMVQTTAKSVRTLTRNLAEGFAQTVGNVTKPILEPIRDSLAGIKNYIGSIETWVKTTLAPLEGLIGTVEEISGYFMIYKTLAGIRSVSDGLDVVAEKAGVETAAKIAELMRAIVDIGTSTVDYVQDLFTAFDKKVVHADDRIKEANELGLRELEALVQQRVTGIQADLDIETRRLDRDLVRIERRIEDLPHFTGMLIRALR